jgi:hypothetical protein
MLVIDFIKPMSVNPKLLTTEAPILLDRLVDQTLKPRPPKEATLDEMAEQYRVVMRSASFESCRLLMERGSAKNPETGLYYITRDPRIKLPIYYSFPNEFLVEIAKGIKCEMLVLKASKGLVFEHPKTIKVVQDELEKATKSFKIVDIEGKHHVHMDKPHHVAPYVLDFLFDENPDSLRVSSSN